jgi:hypothetical protein
MGIYRPQVIYLLDQEPELADEPATVAERLGCSINTARTYINAWKETRHITWALDRVRRTTACGRCKQRDACEVLDALELPVLCEKVPESEVILAELNGMTDVMLASRGQKA